MRILAGLSVLALALAPTAFAEDIEGISIFRDMPCDRGHVDPLALRAKLVGAAKLEFTDELSKAYQGGRLGTLARHAGDGEPLRVFFGQVGDLLAREPEDFDGMTNKLTITRKVSGAESRAELFLNGATSNWLQLTCKAPSGQSATSAGQEKQIAFTLGKTKKDLVKSFDDREFAELSLTSKSGDTSVDAEIAVGWKAMPVFGQEDISWAPYVALDRQTAGDPEDHVNKVEAGAQFIFGVGRFPAVFTATPSYLTDDRGAAAVWKAEVEASFSALPFCQHLPISEKSDSTPWFSGCTISTVVDYLDVDDPGANADWAKLTSATRAGLDFEAKIGWKLPVGVVSLTGDYQSRFDITDHEATAELWKAELALKPGDAEHFQYSISYSKGKELDTLKHLDTLKLSVGFKY